MAEVKKKLKKKLKVAKKVRAKKTVVEVKPTKLDQVKGKIPQLPVPKTDVEYREWLVQRKKLVGLSGK